MRPPTTSLIPLDAIDPAQIEALLDRAFEPSRRRRTAYRLRDGAEWLPALSFAALDGDGELVGTIQCWPIGLAEAAGRVMPLIMVGPVAVLPERQGGGIGAALMLAMLGALSPATVQKPIMPQMMIGDAGFYGRFGFAAAPPGWRLPGPWESARLLVRSENPAVLPTEGMLGPWRG